MSRAPKVLSAGPRLAARADAARRERRHRWWRRAGWASAGIVPLVVLGWVLLGSSLLGAELVVVSGEQRLSAAQVERAAAITPGTPLARLDTAAVARRVETLGPVREVTVTRGWPNTVRIAVVERVPVVAVPQRGAVVLLDREGVEVERVRSAPPGVLTLAVTSPGPADPSTRAALTVYRSLPLTLRGRLSSLRAPTPEQVTLLLKDGRTVLWGGADNGLQKIAAVKALLAMPGRVYDVSAPGVVTRR